MLQSPGYCPSTATAKKKKAHSPDQANLCRGALAQQHAATGKGVPARVLQRPGQTMKLTSFFAKVPKSPAIDMSVALEQVDLVLTKLEEMGTNAEAEFHNIFSLCQDRAAEFGVKCEIPRVVGTQRYLANYPCSYAEEYYRRATFIPYIDDLNASLKRRFANHRKTLRSLQFVLPKHASKGKFQSVQPAFDFYLRDMTTTHILTLRG
ncbi:hypothetical protein HPB48_001568 [Haemaphysalis longicornis]|uniref:Uncharacterized protein n=1 Tax=Haemaphysalis longicornis TaxID=44386 RepID=A0A9J6FE05_HAELO|nr:hypothetical protein HPB48_001568 [Haemaphysalis longicornis]